MARLIMIAGAALAVCWPRPVHAEMGPARPSQVVTVSCVAHGTVCRLNGTGGSTVTTIDADGNATSGFSLPAGSVFVLTSYSAAVDAAGAAIKSGTFGLYVIVPNTPAKLIAHDTAPMSFNWTLDINDTFPTGIVIRSPGPFQFFTQTDAEFDNVNVLVTVNGYIAKDK